MNTIAVSRKEGGDWIPFTRVSPYSGAELIGAGGEVHAIKYENGAIWDTVNGWRKTTKIRVKMGRELI